MIISCVLDSKYLSFAVWGASQRVCSVTIAEAKLGRECVVGTDGRTDRMGGGGRGSYISCHRLAGAEAIQENSASLASALITLFLGVGQSKPLMLTLPDGLPIRELSSVRSAKLQKPAWLIHDNGLSNKRRGR